MMSYVAIPPPPDWTIDADEALSSVASAALVANQVYLYACVVLTPVQVAGISLNAATPTGTVDVGIYDHNGNLLIDSGAIAAVNATHEYPFTSQITLAPGRYFLAMCPSVADAYFRKNGLPAGMSRTYQAVNNGTAGVLPATTGGETAASVLPQMSLQFVGGMG